MVIKGNVALTQINYMKLPWQYGSEVQYLKIAHSGINLQKYPQCKNLETLLEDLQNLKSICIHICDRRGNRVCDWSGKDKFVEDYQRLLKKKGIENLELSEFEEKVQFLSNDFPFVFHLNSSCQT